MRHKIVGEIHIGKKEICCTFFGTSGADTVNYLLFMTILQTKLTAVKYVINRLFFKKITKMNK